MTPRRDRTPPLACSLAETYGPPGTPPTLGRVDLPDCPPWYTTRCWCGWNRMSPNPGRIAELGREHFGSHPIINRFPWLGWFDPRWPNGGRCRNV